MSEGGQASPASHYHFRNKSFFHLEGLAAQTGTVGERHAPGSMSALKWSLSVKAFLYVRVLLASIRLQTIEERVALVHLGFLLSALLLQPPSVL